MVWRISGFNHCNENERAEAGRDGRTRLAKPNSQARTGTRKTKVATRQDESSIRVTTSSRIGSDYAFKVCN